MGYKESSSNANMTETKPRVLIITYQNIIRAVKGFYSLTIRTVTSCLLAFGFIHGSGVCLLYTSDAADDANVV